MNNFILSGQPLAEGVALSWPRVANAVRYEVRRREPLSQVAVVGTTEKAVYLDEETFTDADYVYRVRAILEDGESLDSLMLDITACGPRTATRITIGAKGINRE